MPPGGRQQGTHRPAAGRGAHARGGALMERIVALALAEDLGEAGDITAKAIFGAGDAGAARIVSREPCTVSGLLAAREVCRQVDAGLEWLPLVADGDAVPAGAQVARLGGAVISILAAERTLLNFLSRLSGVATITRCYVSRIEGLPARVAATRKTSPGLRFFEKQAVVHGGGDPHRFGLYDAVLIKDNHIAAAGGVTAAVSAVRRALGPGTEIEVEIDDPSQLSEAIEAGASRVLLDNMSAAQVRLCVEGAAGRAVIEASGGIDLATVRSFAEAGAGVISVGALTRAAPGIDFSLEIGA